MTKKAVIGGGNFQSIHMITFIRYHCRDSMVIVVMAGGVILQGPYIIPYN